MFRTRRKPEAPATPRANNLADRTLQLGRELLTAMRGQGGPGALSKKFWSDKLINWTLQDERFKSELFRFIDVFPTLKSPADVHTHLVDYLDRPGIKLPTGMGLALKAGGLLKGTLARTISSQIDGMARTFITGTDLAESLPILESRWKEGIAFSLDLLGEACVSHAEAAAYRARYTQLIEGLPSLVAKFAQNPILESDHLGKIARANVSIKISALDGHVSPIDTEGSVSRLVSMLEPLLQSATRLGVLVNFDMEHHALKDLTLELFKRCCEKFPFEAGLALQAYLKSADADARSLSEWAKSRGRVVTVRLIKGAYWDYETIHSEIMGWPIPVWETKPQTDACFERLTQYFIDKMPRKPGEGGVKLALGTHNVRSIAHGIACLESAGLPNNAIEFQALRGMAEELKSALAEKKWRIREYQPIGEMIPGMAYLVRRLLENTSNEGWLRAGQSADVSDDALLASPHERAASGPTEMPARPNETTLDMPFSNEPFRDFTDAEMREAFHDAVKRATVPTVANDSTEQQAKAAVAAGLKAFPAWRDRPATERAQILLKAAALMRAKRDELSAIVVRESNKIWSEADADVCEAIDFCEYYARESLPLFTPRRLGKFVGELNHAFHQPRGVAAIISPWNFPMAICAGMTVAALVTGNCAIVKPAEQTPAIAKKMCEALWQAGIPKDVLQFLPGVGEIVGAALVRDPRISIIAFTGSKDVGLNIVRAAAETPPEQLWVKRVICEMGGKNAIIVDGSADLDEAVLGVRQSAFGFAGQKCSAGSRVVVLDSIHDAFVARLVESTRSLKLDDPTHPSTDVGPVIDAEAAQKIEHYIEIGKQEATLAYPDSAAAGTIKNQKSKIKNLIPPHIFVNVLPSHRIAREEIFGPVLAVLRAKDFDEALAIANDSVYKLTGGIFTRTPTHLERARTEFRVGNLYINRGITGALVGRQPFGGFGLSGVGAKAGGPDYLLQFTDPRNITENTMRRGFAPSSD